MEIQEIAEKVAAAVKEAPEKAQELIADPHGVVEEITGAAQEFDPAELLQTVMGKLSEVGADLSNLDLSKANLSAIDVSKLDLGSLAESAKGLGVDISKLDVGDAISSKIGNLVGGLFGKKE